MPLKLSINFCRKVGEANYGSRGATVGLEMEAETSLVHQPDQLGDQVARLFRLARESVERELARPPASAANGATRNGSATRPVARAATANQIRALHAIAGELSLDLASELRDRLGVGSADQLTLVEASELIDALKSAARERVLGGGAQPSAGDDGGLRVVVD